MERLFDIKGYKDHDVDILTHLIDVSLHQTKVDSSKFADYTESDWNRFFTLTNKLEVAALVSDIIAEDGIDVPIEVRLKFLGMQEVVERNVQNQVKVAAELLHFFNAHNLPTLVFKGLSISRYYPQPLRRKHGDIDIYQFGLQPQSDRLVSNTFDVEVKQYVVGHHTYYDYCGTLVENHSQFITTYFGGQSLEFESILEEELNNTVHTSVMKESVQFPSSNFNALYLLYHMANHFREERATLRQMIDWMMFLEHEYDRVDWKRIHGFYEKFHLVGFFNAINGILIQYFGMPAKFAYGYEKDEALETRIFEDTLKIPSKKQDEEDGLFFNIGHELSQYVKSGWKYRLFNMNGTGKMLEKLWAYIKHPSDFKEEIVYSGRANGTK